MFNLLKISYNQHEVLIAARVYPYIWWPYKRSLSLPGAKPPKHLQFTFAYKISRSFSAFLFVNQGVVDIQERPFCH